MTVNATLRVPFWPAVSVTVSVTSTLPAAVVSSDALDEVELVRLANVAPPVIAHWYVEMPLVPPLGHEPEPSNSTDDPTVTEAADAAICALIAEAANAAAPASAKPAPQVLVVQ